MRSEIDQQRHFPLIIGGEEVWTDDRLESRDPGETSRVLGLTARAPVRNRRERPWQRRSQASHSWSQMPPEDRASVLIRAAEILRRRRFELAAWEAYECGKPWQEADGDICEAIDFCEFYAREMIRLGRPTHRDVPGETNVIEHLARGVVVIIPPWNFPLAIPMGMTVAALVAGNAVVLKPAEQAPIMAYHLVQVLKEAGLPPGVLNYLPGRGEEAGQALVDNPDVNLISFTGSRAVGLEIYRRAADTKPGQSTM